MSGPASTRVLGVVANWNRRASLLRCLERLARVRVPPGFTLDLLVVDNDSADGSRDAVTARFPSVAVLNTGANLGGSGAFRAGLARAVERDYDLGWLLDNDAYPSTRILERYVAAWRQLGPNVLLGGTMHVAEAPRVIHEAGGLFRPGRATRPPGDAILSAPLDVAVGIRLLLHQRRSTLQWRRDRPFTDVDYLAFANLLVPVAVVRAIGLPEDLFLHYDDVEFCLRAHRAGYRVVNVPDAVYWHESGQAKPPTWVHYYDARNSLYAVELALPDELGHKRRRLLYSAAKHLLAGRSAVARLILRGIRDHSRRVTGGVAVAPDGFGVHDVRRTDPHELLAAYRCRYLVLDWDSVAGLFPCYRRAWWEFLARCPGRAYLALDTDGGPELYDFTRPPWAGSVGGPGPALTAVGQRRGRALLAESLYARSPHRTGVRTRLRLRACQTHLGVHGAILIDADRLPFGAKAATAIQWAWTWATARQDPGRAFGAGAPPAVERMTWSRASTIPVHPAS